MLWACRKYFDRLYSIEFDPELYTVARDRLSSLSYVTILQGDSTAVLPSLLRTLDSPVLFWLDAHYSGGVTGCADLESPIASELAAIAQHQVKGHVVLIDDAHDFNGTNGYLTVDAVRDVSRRLGYEFVLRHNIMRLVPQ
jgi:hypothetical protein